MCESHALQAGEDDLAASDACNAAVERLGVREGHEGPGARGAVPLVVKHLWRIKRGEEGVELGAHCARLGGRAPQPLHVGQAQERFVQ